MRGVPGADAPDLAPGRARLGARLNHVLNDC
jgi:hypothetical protein